MPRRKRRQRDLMGLWLVAACPTAARAQAAAPTQAPEAPSLCATPSGLGTNTCVFPRGSVVVETSLVDWTADRSERVHDDTILIGQTLVRVGILRKLELQVGWTPYGHERVRDQVTGQRYGADTTGDVTLGAKYALVAATDEPFSVAAQPFVQLPTGRAPVSSGKIGGGMVLPIGYDLTSRITFELTPEIDLLGDQDGRRRHLEYNVTAGVAAAASRRLYLTGEYRFLRNQDPLHRRTTHVAALSLAWQPRPLLQLNLGAAAGLTPDSPRAELIFGFARRFR